MRALIHNGRVVDVQQEDFPVHNEMQWVDCPDDCKAYQWTYDGSQVNPPVPVPPVVKTREELRRAEYPSIESRLDDLFDKGAFSPEMTTQIQAINDRHR